MHFSDLSRWDLHSKGPRILGARIGDLRRRYGRTTAAPLALWRERTSHFLAKKRRRWFYSCRVPCMRCAQLKTKISPLFTEKRMFISGIDPTDSTPWVGGSIVERSVNKNAWAYDTWLSLIQSADTYCAILRRCDKGQRSEHRLYTPLGAYGM